MPLDWGSERYVKVFTRDTPDWLMLSWEAQCLFLQLLRKADRAGVLHLGRHGKQAVMVQLGRPALWPALEPALDELLADSCVVLDGDRLLIRNYIEAQETPADAKTRKQAQRLREKSLGHAASRDVTNGHAMSRDVERRDETSEPVTPVSRDVTRGHALTQNVTPAVPCRAEPAVPCQPLKDLRAASAAPPDPGEQPTPSQVVAPEPPPSRPATPSPKASPQAATRHDMSRDVTKSHTKSRPPDPRHAPLLKRLCDAFEAIRGAAFPVDGHQAKALTSLLAKGPDEAILECWNRALGSDEYPRVRTLAELDKNWPHFAGVGPPKSSRPAPPPVPDAYGRDVGRAEQPQGKCEACGAQGNCVDAWKHVLCAPGSREGASCYSQYATWEGLPEGEPGVLEFIAGKRKALEPAFTPVPPPRLQPVPEPKKPSGKSKLGGDPFAGLPAKPRVHVGKRKAVHA